MKITGFVGATNQDVAHGSSSDACDQGAEFFVNEDGYIIITTITTITSSSSSSQREVIEEYGKLMAQQASAGKSWSLKQVRESSFIFLSSLSEP